MSALVEFVRGCFHNNQVDRRTFLQCSGGASAEFLFLRSLVPGNMPMEKPKQESKTLLEVMAAPFVAEANKRRVERGENPRVNPKLNHIYTMVLFGYGETYEPSSPEDSPPPGIFIGSYTIIYYDSLRKTWGKLSLSHDHHSPEVAEKIYGTRNVINPSTRVSAAYEKGGHELMRKVLEDAFGLNMDFQVVFKDEEIKNVVDSVFEGIDIDVQNEASIYEIYLNGKKEPKHLYPKGKQKLTGILALQYIKGVPIPRLPGDYQKELEHHLRETTVMQSLKETLVNRALNIFDPLFKARLVRYLYEKLNKKGLDYDFDWKSLAIDNLFQALTQFTGVLRQGDMDNLKIPDFSRDDYMADSRSGAGISVRNSSGDMFFPINGNPYGADSIKDYWFEFRNFVENIMLPG